MKIQTIIHYGTGIDSFADDKKGFRSTNRYHQLIQFLIVKLGWKWNFIKCMYHPICHNSCSTTFSVIAVFFQSCKEKVIKMNIHKAQNFLTS